MKINKLMLVLSILLVLGSIGYLILAEKNCWGCMTYDEFMARDDLCYFHDKPCSELTYKGNVINQKILGVGGNAG